MLSFWAGAATTPGNNLFAAVNNNLNAAWNQYEATAGFGTVQVPLSDAVTITSFNVWCAVAPGVGTSWTLTIRDNAANTSAAVTVSGTNTSGSWSGSVSCAQLDKLSIGLTSSGSPATGTIYWNISYSTAGNFYLIPAVNTNFMSANGVWYQSPMGGNNLAPTTTAGNQAIVVPSPITVTKIAAMTGGSPSGGSWTTSVYKANTSTASSFSAVTPASAASFTPELSATGSMAFSAGDTLTIQENNTSSTWDRLATCMTVVPSTSGEVVLGFGNTNSPSSSAASYEQPQGMGSNSWNATESNVYTYLPAGTLAKFYVSVPTAPGTGTSYAFTLRAASANTALTATISGTNTTANDTGHSVIESAAQLCSIGCVPSSSPGFTSGVNLGFVIVIPQPSQSPPPPIQIPNPYVGPPALRKRFRFPRKPQRQDAIYPPPPPGPATFGYQPVRIPNPRVGPPVLRRLFRQQSSPQRVTPAQPAPTTPQGYRPVQIPNAYVGPPALRGRFRYPTRPRLFDTAGAALATQCTQIWQAAQAAQQAEINLRHTTPLVRIWDGNWKLQFLMSTAYDATFSWIVNDSGPGRTEIPYTDPCAQWIADDVDRVANGNGRNVHITVDYCGARWGGRMDRFSIEQRADGDTVLVVDWLHDYENLKWYTVWSNPFLPAEIQFPRAFILVGPITWILKLALFLQIFREHNPLIRFLDDPLSLTGGLFNNLDMSSWHVVVKPQSFIDAANSGVAWGLISSRFANWHDMAHVMLEDAQLSVQCTRYLPGDPPPWPGANLRYGTLVVDLVDQSGIYVGTSNGGNIFDGLVRTVEQFSSDFVNSTVSVLADTAPPQGYYIPGGNKYTDPSLPYVVYKQGTNTPIETSAFIVSPHKGLQITVGGHSMPGVNEVISASIQAGFGVLGSLAGIGSLGSTIDTLVKPLYEDTILAWMTLELPARADAGWDYYFEYFQQGANKAYTIAALMVWRAGAWATRNFVSWKVQAIDGLPYTVGDRGLGHFFIGDRVGLVLQGDPHQRIWMDRVRKIDLHWKDDAWPEWDLSIGDDRILQDPAQRAWGQIEQIIAALRDLGVY